MSEILNDLKACSDKLAKTLTRDFVSNYIKQGGDPDTFKETLFPVEQQNIASVRRLLSLPEFAQEIGSKRITFAMIRPSLDLGSQDGTDEEVAQRIFQQIQEKEFRTPINLSWPIGKKRITQFYGHVKFHMLEIPLDAPDGTPSNRWDLFLELCTSGATSLLVLYKELVSGDEPVWKQWRETIGDKIISQAKEGTLRKVYGSEYNNIAHGSDSLSAVRRDISWMTKQLK